MTFLVISIATAFLALMVGCFVALSLRHRKRRLATGSYPASQVSPATSVLPADRPVSAFPAIMASTKTELSHVSGLTLRQAEELLDWLENNGFVERALVCEANDVFAVEFRRGDQTIKFATLHVPHAKWRRSSVS